MAAGDADPTIADEAHPIAPSSARSVLRYPTFRRVYFGAFLSNIGMWMQNVALGTLAYDLTGSASFVGLVVFAQLGPMLFLAPIGGLMADRLDRRKVLAVVAATQIVLSLALAVIVLPVDPNRTLLLLAVVGIGVGQAIYGPTFSALIPQLVDRRDLSAAISLNSAQMNGSRVIGPVIGGVINSLTNESVVFGVNAASRLFVIAAVLSVQLPRPSLEGATRGLRALREGFVLARRDPVVLRCLITISLYSLISLPFIGQLPVVAERNLGVEGSSTTYSILFACFGAGAVIGALSISTVFSRYSNPRITRTSLAAFGVALGVLALLRGPAPAFPVVAVVGFTYFAFVTSLVTVLQEQVADAVRGRIMALWIMGWAGMVPIGNLVAGPLIDATSMTLVMLVGAAFSLALTSYVRLDRTPAPAATPVAAACVGR